MYTIYYIRICTCIYLYSDVYICALHCSTMYSSPYICRCAVIEVCKDIMYVPSIDIHFYSY